ncbi:hypothetical protein EGW08_007626 [Elysia chlorotica]|uniref:Uncharacterized protein n=1 Tax=Elysia chlorotica TaxID=188477 RepID=A0A433TSL3_ELYCH|nr:hypothetical protein EGW08_007626 [Elysia chlorotica]
MENHQKISSILYEVKLKESQIRSVKNDISRLKDEVENLKLEEMWCYDPTGKRIVPTAEEQAAEISQNLAEYPHLVEDTVKALLQKKLDLQNDLDELRQKSSEIDPFS